MKVLLVGNYEPDRQWSMQRFASMLQPALREEGIETELIKPPALLGRQNKWLAYLDKFLLFRPTLHRAVKYHAPSVVHILDQGNAIYATWLAQNNRPTSPTPIVVTCHDILAIRSAKGEFPSHPTSLTGKLLQNQILRGLRRATRLVCVSRATQRDTARLIGESTLIPNGLEPFWKPTATSQKNHLLHVGGAQWYKNREAVIHSFIALRKTTSHNPKLIIAGPKLNAPLAAALREAALAEDVTTLQNVSDDSLRTLYSEARLLLFPSRAEGFGWPILEAQACACPVVTTDADPMRETAGRAAIFSTETDLPKALARTLDQSPSERAALITAGLENAAQYSTKKMARAYSTLYQSLIK